MLKSNAFFHPSNIEMQKVQMGITYLFLHRSQCPCCGKLNKVLISSEQRADEAPRLTALIAEMTGIFGNSRTNVADFCSSVLSFHISLGAIQKVIDRAP
jgi:transposase